MRSVVFVNRYFYPDHSATSQIASDLAFHLASRGWEVAAITSRQKYDDPWSQLPGETVRGVRIDRIWTTRFGRGSLVGRGIDYGTFYFSAFARLRRYRGSVVVALTDPPLISIVAATASPRLVNWVQDLFPEVARELGLPVPRFLAILRDWSLRRARRNVVIGEAMGKRVPGSVVVHNWAGTDVRPIARDANRLRREWGLGDAFVVGYSGNFGRVHDLDTVTGAMGILADEQARGSIRFLFAGSGAKLEEVKRRGGSHAVFLPYQPRERLSESLSAADVHLVTLEPALEGLVVPSKFYGALAAGRPVIFVGARGGELARLVEHHRCGLAVTSGDGEALAAAVRYLEADRQECQAMGSRGLELYGARFAPRHAFAAWERILDEAAP